MTGFAQAQNFLTELSCRVPSIAYVFITKYLQTKILRQTIFQRKSDGLYENSGSFSTFLGVLGFIPTEWRNPQTDHTHSVTLTMHRHLLRTQRQTQQLLYDRLINWRGVSFSFFLLSLGAILPREQPVPRLLCGIMVIEHITRKVGTYSYDTRSNNLWGSL